MNGFTNGKWFHLFGPTEIISMTIFEPSERCNFIFILSLQLNNAFSVKFFSYKTFSLHIWLAYSNKKIFIYLNSWTEKKLLEGSTDILRTIDTISLSFFVIRIMVSMCQYISVSWKRSERIWKLYQSRNILEIL